jgi:hypothetical protein
VFDHIIMFKAEGLDADTEGELMRQLASLGDVPGIVDFALGKNVGDRSRGFDYCMRITFLDQEAHDAYQADPHHQAVVRYNRTVTTEHICVDFLWSRTPGSASEDGEVRYVGEHVVDGADEPRV